MNASAERSRSIWMDTGVAPRAPMLDQDLSVDTVIVGSGIAGLSVAYELAIEGRKVAILDRGPIAGGITARTTAHLTSLCDESFKSLIEWITVRSLTGEFVAITAVPAFTVRSLRVFLRKPGGCD